MQPGPAGLVPCDPGTRITVRLCNDSSRSNDALTILDFGFVGANGGFSLALDGRKVRNSRLVFRATIVQETIQTEYRIVDFGRVGAGGSASLDDLVIDPISEAAVRLLYEQGLQHFTDAGIEDVVQAVRTANADATFAGTDPVDAAALSTETARADPMVQVAIQNAQLTPTPTPQPACTGDCNSSGEVTVNELLTMVNIALGNADISACLAGDSNHDGSITINEILAAVSRALNAL